MKLRSFKSVTIESAIGSNSRIGRLRSILALFVQRRLVRELVEAFGEHRRLKGTRFLAAHGKKRRKTYRYVPDQNAGKSSSVQKWIDEHDGRHAVLVIGACNNRNHVIRSKHSIVVHPDQPWSLMTFVRKRSSFVRVFVPDVGYVEHDCRLMRKIIERLKEDKDKA